MSYMTKRQKMAFQRKQRDVNTTPARNAIANAFSLFLRKLAKAAKTNDEADWQACRDGAGDVKNELNARMAEIEAVLQEDAETADGAVEE